MSEERHERLTAIFLAASDLEPEERRAYLDQACPDDPELRAQIERMLAADSRPPGILEPGGVGRALCLDVEAVPERIGPYRIVEQLGAGGMGVVYLAEQEAPVRRQVALKLIRRGLETTEVLERFATERQALALMSHPSVAQVYDAGMTPDGRPYFAMEYVAGRPITEYCDEQRLDLDARLRLLALACLGVQHAHHKGIIHRDIKATNVLVHEVDEKPVPKIIDFGIAKATERSPTGSALLTQAGQLFGTPAYMSPEQAAENPRDVDTRTDVYALGALLYELVAGSPPFESSGNAGIDELRRRIREDEPSTPSARVAAAGAAAAEIAARRGVEPRALVRRLAGELDWIVMKALAKERERRYATPADLAADLGRHLSGEAVLAGKPSRLYRARKFARKHRTGVTVGALFVLLAVAFGVAVAREARRADRAAALARAEAQRARDELRHAEGISAFLIQLFETAEVDAVAGQCISVCDLVAGAIGDLERLEGQPLVQSRLMLMLGAIARSDERIAEGRATLAEALSTMDERSGTLDFLEEAAWGTAILRRLDEAELTFEHLVRVRGRRLGPEHAETLLTRAELGRVYTLEGRLADAATQLAATLEAMRRTLGDEHAHTLRTVGYLASVLWRQGRIEEMGALLSDALEPMRRVLGPRHHVTLATHYNLARVEARAGRRSSALDHLRQAVEGGFVYMGQDAEGRIVMGHPGMRADPYLAALREDPEFEAILRRAL